MVLFTNFLTYQNELIRPSSSLPTGTSPVLIVFRMFEQNRWIENQFLSIQRIQKIYAFVNFCLRSLEIKMINLCNVTHYIIANEQIQYPVHSINGYMKCKQGSMVCWFSIYMYLLFTMDITIFCWFICFTLLYITYYIYIYSIAKHKGNMGIRKRRENSM